MAIANMQDTTFEVPKGLVLPPKEIKAIIEKTAKYVARNGQLFEQRIREKELNNAKFSFLSPVDAYYKYYKWRMDQVKSGEQMQQDSTQTDGSPKRPVGLPLEEAYFVCRMPNLCSVDLLVAQFGNTLGRQFITGLCQRESRNAQFDFLRPNHSYYRYFVQQVDQYTASSGANRKKKRPFAHKRDILSACRSKASVTKESRAKEEKLEAETRRENVLFAQIDWHDFSVVETIQFVEGDEAAALPPPLDLHSLLTKSLEEKAVCGGSSFPEAILAANNHALAKS